MKTKIIKLDDETIEISKLPIGKYSELLKAVKELPKHINGLEKKSADEIIKILPSIIGESLPDLIEILVIATPIKKEKIELMGLDDITKIVLGVIEVNNYRDVYDSIKKAVAQPITTVK